MLAQQTQGHDVSGGNDSRTPPSRVEKRPMTYMFIDSSNGGVNAKPDKVVRSFVMKSARNKKPWSTKSKSLRAETPARDRSCRRPSTGIESSNGQLQTSGWLPELECGASLAPWDEQTVTSPSSSRSNSVLSSYSSNPESTYTSPYAEYDDAENSSVLLNLRQPALRFRTRSNVGFVRSLDCLAVQLDTAAERLLHQFVEASAPHLLPIDPHKFSKAAAIDWIATCIQSPIGAPFIYAALTTSARVSKLNSDFYKWQAIYEVNRLLVDPSKSTDDTTIAAVLILLALEEADLADPRKKDHERIRMNEAHLNGLRTMIAQRGGLAALGENRCLQVFILMHSVAHSIATFKRPYALLFDANGQIEDYSPLSFQSAHSFTHILRQFHNLAIDRTLFDIISTITIFVSDLSTWYDTGICPVDPLDLQKHASLLMYRLFNWYERRCAAENQDTQSCDQSICLALLIFMVIATEPNASAFGSRLSKAVTKLRLSLQPVPMSRWSSTPDLLLWTLTIGALGAKSLPNKACAPELSFFTRYCRIAFAGSDFNDTTTANQWFERMMKTCLWIPSIFDERAKRLWVSMGLCKAEVTDMEDLSSSSSEGEWDQVVDEEYALGQSTTRRFFAVDGKRRAKEVATR